MNTYRFAQKISPHTEDWNKVVLPMTIYQHVSDDLHDIRIYGITPQNDTIEAPYIIQNNAEKAVTSKIKFRTLNRVNNGKGFYYTYQIVDKKPINQIKLDIHDSNYDLRLRLEGSNDQSEWFTILEDYRILSIQNSVTSYSFSTLNFSTADYAFYRVHHLGTEDPGITQASISHLLTQPGQAVRYQIQEMKVKEDQKTNQTKINIQLEHNVPVDEIEIKLKDQINFIRPIRFEYLRDSVKTNKGWIENYQTISRGQLSSLENNIFKNKSIRTRALRITIDHHDNQPLKMDSVIVSGYTNHLITRLNEAVDYYLVYGREKSTRPRYDISRFANDLKEDIPSLHLDPPSILKQKIASKTKGFFEHKAWLYGIMGLIILLIGWSTIRMMRNVDE